MVSTRSTEGKAFKAAPAATRPAEVVFACHGPGKLVEVARPRGPAHPTRPRGSLKRPAPRFLWDFE